MALFVGTVENKVDRKGRVSVPARFRAALVDQGFAGAYVFPSYKVPALEAFGEAIMNRLAAGLDSMAMFSDDQDDLTTTIFAQTHPLSFDDTGRILLPEALMVHAGIGERAAFVGQGNRFQIWEPGRLREHIATARQRAGEKRLTAPLGPAGGAG